MPKWPAIAIDEFLHQDAVGPIYLGYGMDGTDVTESDMQQEVRGTYTAANFRSFVTVLVGEDLIIQFRKNGADGNQVQTATGTGEWEDTSNTDSLVSGDLIGHELDQSAGMHGDDFNTSMNQITLDAATDIPPVFGSIADIIGGVDWYYSIFGNTNSDEFEVEAEYTNKRSRTFRDLRVVCPTFTTTNGFNMRKNRADGNGTVTVTGTGEFIDTTNTDSYVDGDEVNYDGSGGGSAFIQVVATKADTSSSLLAAALRVGGTQPETFYFFSPVALPFTEDEAELEAEDAATIQNLQVNISAQTETVTIRTRKNMANGNLSIFVNGTGIFEDTSNKDSLVAEDDMALARDAPSGGGLNNYEVMAVEWETLQGPSAALSGTITDDTEADIRNGGSTIILDLSNDTWVAAGATFDAQRQGIIDGLDSDGSETDGWDAVVLAALDVGDVVRTSDTRVTITIPVAGIPGYNITGTETITATIPASAVVTSADPLIANPTFDITFLTETVAVSGSVTESANENDVRAGALEIILTLTNVQWEADVGDDNAQTQALIDGIDSNLAEGTGWDTVVRDGLGFGDVVRTSDTVVTITLPAFGSYDITATEIITVIVPASALDYPDAITASPTFDIAVLGGAYGGAVGIQQRELLLSSC